jgi:hypothetical protein
MAARVPCISPINFAHEECLDYDERIRVNIKQVDESLKMCLGSLPTRDFRRRCSPKRTVNIPGIENRACAISWMKEVRYMAVNLLDVICYQYMFLCRFCISVYSAHLTRSTL